MKNLVYAVALLFLAACSPKLAPDQKWPDKKWTLYELNGTTSLKGAERDITFQFNTAEQRISGYGGCNQVGGPYTMDAKGSLKFGLLISTRMACPDMSTEDALMAALPAVDSYEVKGSELWLKKGEQVLMKFR